MLVFSAAVRFSIQSMRWNRPDTHQHAQAFISISERQCCHHLNAATKPTITRSALEEMPPPTHRRPECCTAEHLVRTWPSKIRTRCKYSTIPTQNYDSQAHLTFTLPRSRDASLSKAEYVTSISLGWHPVQRSTTLKSTLLISPRSSS